MSNSAEALARTAPREDDPTPIRRRGERPHGNARRVLLLQTTLRLIADEGIDAVSHRSVAEAAGVPLGSTTYWFSSRQEMLRRRSSTSRGWRSRRSASASAPCSAGASRAGGWSTSSPICWCPSSARQRWRTVAQYALLQEAARQPELEPVCREWTAAWERGPGGGLRLARQPRPRARGADVPGDARRPAPGAAGSARPRIRAANVIRPALRAWFGRDPGSPVIVSRRRLAAALGVCAAIGGARRLRKQRRHRGIGRRLDGPPDGQGAGQAQRRSHDLELGALHRQEDDSGVRAGDGDQRRLHRGHQQLRRVLRQDAAAALPGRVGQAGR